MKWLRRGRILQTGILQIADPAENAPRVQSARSAKSSYQQIAFENTAHFPMLASVEPAFNRANHVLNPKSALHHRDVFPMEIGTWRGHGRLPMPVSATSTSGESTHVFSGDRGLFFLTDIILGIVACWLWPSHSPRARRSGPPGPKSRPR